MLKIIRVKIFRVDKFSRFRSIREIFLTVDDCNMDERLESLWLLVYYQVSGEPGIARCSHQSDIYLGALLLVMNTDNFHWQQTIHLQTAPTVYTRSSDPNPDCNPGSTHLRKWHETNGSLIVALCQSVVRRFGCSVVRS